SDSAINEDLLDRARQLGIPVGGWHVAVRIEADEEEEHERDEVQRFELLESAGQVALDAAAATGGTWYQSRMARAIVLDRGSASSGCSWSGTPRTPPGPRCATSLPRSRSSGRRGRRPRSRRSPPTSTSRGRSSRPPSGCTCTATRWPTGCVASQNCLASTSA